MKKGNISEFPQLVNKFLEAITNAPPTRSYNRKKESETANSITIYNLKMSKYEFKTHIQPILDNFTNDLTIAEIMRIDEADDKQSFGQEFYYELQFRMKQQEEYEDEEL